MCWADHMAGNSRIIHRFSGLRKVWLRTFFLDSWSDTQEVGMILIVGYFLIECWVEFMIPQQLSLTINIIEWEIKSFDKIKGQLISKCLFGVFNSPKKRTKTIRLEVCTSIVVKSNFFVCFMGELKIPKRHFGINWPLVKYIFDQILRYVQIEINM